MLCQVLAWEVVEHFSGQKISISEKLDLSIIEGKEKMVHAIVNEKISSKMEPNIGDV